MEGEGNAKEDEWDFTRSWKDRQTVLGWNSVKVLGQMRVLEGFSVRQWAVCRSTLKRHKLLENEPSGQCASEETRTWRQVASLRVTAGVPDRWEGLDQMAVVGWEEWAIQDGY